MEKEMLIYKKALEEKNILSGLVVLTQFDDDLESEILMMDLDGIKGVIKREDVDYQVEWNTLVGFIGKKVSFIVKEIDEDKGIIYCSRKEAQEILEKEVLSRFEDGESLEATITKLINYGAYVEMLGGVYGLLKNSDFSDYFIPISDVLEEGDTIEVKLSKISANNRLTVEPVEKYEVKTVLNFDNFERDQVVLGTVNGVKPWGAYVTIAPGLDALCPIPLVGEIEKGSKVTFRITVVQGDKKRVRGKIIRILQ